MTFRFEFTFYKALDQPQVEKENNTRYSQLLTPFLHVSKLVSSPSIDFSLPQFLTNHKSYRIQIHGSPQQIE